MVGGKKPLVVDDTCNCAEGSICDDGIPMPTWALEVHAIAMAKHAVKSVLFILLFFITLSLFFSVRKGSGRNNEKAMLWDEMPYFDDESSKWRVASGDLGRAKPRPGRRIPNGLDTLLPVTSKPTISIVRVLMFLVLSFGILTLLASPLAPLQRRGEYPP